MKTRYAILILIIGIGLIIYLGIMIKPVVKPSEKVEILSIENNYLMFGKNFQYRVLLPDSTVMIYKSNDILRVGDKIKI